MEKHPTSCVLHPGKPQASSGCGAMGLPLGAWSLMLGVFILLSQARVSAQSPSPSQPDPLMQLMLSQPAIDISTNVEVRVSFDPPVIRVGEKTTYRVTINAVSDSIRWPDDIFAPMELTMRPSARGQVLQTFGDKLRPATTINHHVTASKP